MISSLTFMLQNRKGKLETYLNNNMDELELEKQHQLWGAITEIDSIMDTLHTHRPKEIEKEVNPDEIFLFRPIHGKDIVKVVTNFISKKFKK